MGSALVLLLAAKTNCVAGRSLGLVVYPNYPSRATPISAAQLCIPPADGPASSVEYRRIPLVGRTISMGGHPPA